MEGTGQQRRRAGIGRIVVVGAGYWALALVLAWLGGAFDGSWGSDADEASHFLNGVMVLDYVKAGLPEPPLAYAERYYRHYPKIGLGHWPPLLAMVEAVWFLVVPLRYGAGIVLMNLMAAAVAVQLWRMGRRWFPEWLALGSGALWLVLPVVRQYSVIFMAEMLLAFCVTAAVQGFARQRTAFGWWAGLALLTKGTAIALAPLPVVATVVAGDWRFFRNRFLWVSGLLVVVLAGGWYWKAPGARHERVAPYGGIGFMPDRLPDTLRAVGENLGPALALLAVVGIAAAWQERKKDGLLLAMLAFLPGHVVLRMIVGAWETRHLVMVYPELLLFALYGLLESRRRVRPGPGQAVLLAAVVLATAWHIGNRWPQRAGTDGFDEAVGGLGSAQRILVAGTVPAEGAFICSVALEDRRPGRTVERATKVLMESDFLGWHERQLVRTVEEAGAVLNERKIVAVVLDREGQQPYMGLLGAYLGGAGEEWERVGVYRERAEVWVRKGQ